MIMILLALVAGFALDGAVAASVGGHEGSLSESKIRHNSELSAEMVAQIDCARTYNSDLKLPSVPSVTAPRQVELTLRHGNGGERRVGGCSQVREACAGRVYVSTKPLSNILVGGSPSDYGVCMLCQLRI